MLVAEPVLLWSLDTEAALVTWTGAALASAGAQVTGLGGRGMAEVRPAGTRDCVQADHVCKKIIISSDRMGASALFGWNRSLCHP